MFKDNYSNSNPLVDILMPAYNREKYITQAIQSVLMQECAFVYRLIIGENCSTDGTREICEEFASANAGKILLLKHSSNLGMAANYKSLFDISSARYIAILESDDFWTDKHKLQKQIEILESKPEVGLVHTNYYALYENGIKKRGHVWEKIDSLSGNVIGSNQTVNIVIHPLSACFRAFLAKENVDFDFIINNNLLTVDIFLWAEICRRTSVFYLDEITGVYRIHSDSITGNRNIESVERFSKTSLAMVNYLIHKYDTPEIVKETFYSQNRIDLIYHYLIANQTLKAKLELENVNVISTFRERIICFSAKHRLGFLCKGIGLFYSYGSRVKQTINRLLGFFISFGKKK